MKQYIMGMITGASLIACAFMFMAATDGGSGRYQMSSFGTGGAYMIDTSNGDMYTYIVLKKKWKKYGGFKD